MDKNFAISKIEDFTARTVFVSQTSQPSPSTELLISHASGAFIPSQNIIIRLRVPLLVYVSTGLVSRKPKVGRGGGSCDHCSHSKYLGFWSLLVSSHSCLSVYSNFLYEWITIKAKLQCHGFPEVLDMMPTLLLAYHHGRTGTSDPYFQSLEYNEYGVIDLAPIPRP